MTTWNKLGLLLFIVGIVVVVRNPETLLQEIVSIIVIMIGAAIFLWESKKG